MQEKIQKLWCGAVEVEGIAASMMMRKADQRYISRCLPLLLAKIDEIKALAANIEEPVKSIDIKAINDVKEPEVQEEQEETYTALETLNTEPEAELTPVENTNTEDIEEVTEPVTLEQAEDTEIAEEEAEAEELNEVESAEGTIQPDSESEMLEKSEYSDCSEATNEDEIAQSTEFEETEDSEVPDDSENVEISEPTLDVEATQSTEPQPQSNTISLDEKLSRKISKNFRQAISLNDKFRFRRELFGNSSQQYDAALDLIAEMSSFDEARDYFLDSYGWDAENPDVKSFFAILSNHYSN